MPKKVLRPILIAIRATLVIAVLGGLIYPLVMTGISEVFFHNQAEGSLITKNSQVIGSQLIGQCYYKTDRNGNYETTSVDGNTYFVINPIYFQSRPSPTVDSNGNPLPCNAANSAASNLGPSSALLQSRINGYVAYLRTIPGIPASTPVPVDLVTEGGSGFDPDISEAAALFQVNMVADARHLTAEQTSQLTTYIENNVQGRVLGLFGEPVVNVLDLNLALDDGAAS